MISQYLSPFRDLGDVRDNEDTAIPVLMIDTAGCDLTELDVPDEMSKANEGRNTRVQVIRLLSFVQFLPQRQCFETFQER